MNAEIITRLSMHASGIMTEVIDIHSHFMAKDTFEDVPKAYYNDAPILTMKSDKESFVKIGNGSVGPIPQAFYSTEAKIAKKAEEGVDVEILSVHPNMFFYHLDAEEGETFSKLQNDAISNCVKDNRGDFQGLATVPLQSVQRATDEMARAIQKLGMIGVEVGSNINGKGLDDPILRPFFKKAEELKALLFIHPNPISSIGRERMSKYNLGLTVGNPADTALAFASMINGGVLREFPNLKVCFAHGGGFIPYQIGRLDRAFHVRKEAGSMIDEPPSASLKRVYVDSDVYEEKALQFLISVMGESNVVIGTDSPMDMHDHKMVSKIRALGLDPDKEDLILGGNISGLLR